MDVNCCRPSKCSKKHTCNHYLVKPIYGKRIKEDLSDLCLPNFRLYIEGSNYLNFSGKEYYKMLLEFYDSEYCNESCGKRSVYDETIKFQSSKVECKLGDSFNCKHENHPTNQAIDSFDKILKAEDEAFEIAGISEGTVTYVCPVCGGEAIANRYKYDGRIHSMGSGCSKCGMMHS